MEVAACNAPLSGTRRIASALGHWPLGFGHCPRLFAKAFANNLGLGYWGFEAPPGPSIRPRARLATKAAMWATAALSTVVQPASRSAVFHLQSPTPDPRSLAPVPRRMLKNSVLPRLLKKVQMPGGVTHQMGTRYPSAGWVQVRGVRGLYVAAPRERGGTHRRWVSADGPFSAAC